MSDPIGGLDVAPDGSVYVQDDRFESPNIVVDMYRRGAAGGSWHREATLDAAYQAADLGGLAFTPAGEVVVPAYGSNQPSERRWPIVAVRSAAGHWGAWRRVGPTATYHLPSPSVPQVDPTGRVWFAVADVDHQVLVASRDPVTHRVSALRATGIIANNFTTAIDGKGRWMVAWRFDKSVHVASWDGTAMVDRHDFTSAGPHPELGVDFPELDRAADGTVLLTYRDNVSTGLTGAQLTPGGTWTVPTVLSRFDDLILGLNVGRGRSGFLVGRERVVGETDVFIEVQEWPSGAAEPEAATTIAHFPIPHGIPLGEVAQAPVVAADGLGDELAVFQHDGSANSDLRYSFRRAGSDAWTAVRRVPAVPGLTNMVQPRLKTDANGDFVASWTASHARTNPKLATVVAGFDAAAPVLGTRVPPRAVRGRTVRMHATARDTWAGLRGTPAWRFGDGATAHGKRARHVYHTPGTYTVTVTVRDRLGHRTTKTRQITILGGATSSGRR